MPARKAAIAILLGAGRLCAADGMADSRPPTRAPSINQIGRRLTERMDFDEGPHTPRYRHRLLLMLDEFASLGRLDFFQTQLSYLPGYGIKAFLIVQDLSQLYAAYGRDASIVSNGAPLLRFIPSGTTAAQPARMNGLTFASTGKPSSPSCGPPSYGSSLSPISSFPRLRKASSAQT